MASPQYSGPWRKIRLQVLERDGYVCQVRGPRCTREATEVDHIVPVAKGGSWFDERNLRASCQPCNNHRVDRTGNDRWLKATTRIMLVVGPPGAGKSTYVEAHRAPGDLVVDYDLLAQALGSGTSHGHDGLHASVMAARNAVLAQIRQGRSQAERAWIISANPAAESVFPFHERVVVDPGKEQVIAQARAAGRPSRWTNLIEDWYAERTGTSTTEPTASRQW